MRHYDYKKILLPLQTQSRSLVMYKKLNIQFQWRTPVVYFCIGSAAVKFELEWLLIRLRSRLPFGLEFDLIANIW